MRAIYSLVILGVIAALVGGCILLEDEPKQDPIVGKWRDANTVGDCDDNKMEIDQFLEGKATFHFMVGPSCYWYDYDVYVRHKRYQEYEISFEYDNDCGEQDGEDSCVVDPGDFEFDCDLVDDELDCKDTQTDVVYNWEDD